jgi:sterol desaturase/sphingolipid hydroxylase (fatty acid hydroxylase superfamily)
MGNSNLMLYAIPVFLLAIWIEYRISHQHKSNRYNIRDLWANLGIGLGDVILGAISATYSTAWMAFFYYQFTGWRMNHLGYTSLGWSLGIWIIALLADDLTYYWFHRTSHTIRVLWACHVVHHSSQYFNFSTAVRNGWVAIMYKPFYWIWMAALGFHPVMIVTCMSLNAIYQFFCHTHAFPFWDRLAAFLSTPGLHAIHHGKNEDCLDKNFAGIFIFYDRLFGTFEPIRPERKIDFGVTHPPSSNHLLEITLHEFRSLLSDIKKSPDWFKRIQYVFRPPGWKPKND